MIQYLLFPGLVWRKENMFCPSLLLIFRTLQELSFIYHGFTSIIWYSFLQLPVWRFFSWKSDAEIKDTWNKIIDGFFIVSGAVVLPAKRNKWAKCSRMDQVKFVKDSLWKVWIGMVYLDMVCLSRPCHFKFFKGCLPQILLGPLLNTLTQVFPNIPIKFLKHLE